MRGKCVVKDGEGRKREDERGGGKGTRREGERFAATRLLFGEKRITRRKVRPVKVVTLL